MSVCSAGCTQGTLYTTTTVYGVLVHQEGAICTTQAQFFKKYSLPCAPWCILRLGGAYCAFLVHKYPIYRCSGVQCTLSKPTQTHTHTKLLHPPLTLGVKRNRRDDCQNGFISYAQQ